MMEIDPTKRPTSAEILQHPWIVNKHQETVNNMHRANTLVKMREFNNERKFRTALCAMISAQAITDSIKSASFKLQKENSVSSVSDLVIEKDSTKQVSEVDKASKESETEVENQDIKEVVERSKSLEALLISDSIKTQHASQFYDKNCCIVKDGQVMNLKKHFSDNLAEKIQTDISKKTKMSSINLKDLETSPKKTFIMVYNRQIIAENADSPSLQMDKTIPEEGPANDISKNPQILSQSSISRVWQSVDKSEESTETGKDWVIVSEHASKIL